MPAITVRNLSIETHRALKVRAARNGRSTEAEIRHILEKVAKPDDRMKLGSLLASIGREARMTEQERAAFERAIARDDDAAEPMSFGE
ncbi:MAG: plasmid stabilization protein [Rhizobiaceae bacterium]